MINYVSKREKVIGAKYNRKRERARERTRESERI